MELTPKESIYERTAGSFQDFLALVEEAKQHLVGGPEDCCMPDEF